jgi:hypothetical protein
MTTSTARFLVLKNQKITAYFAKIFRFKISEKNNKTTYV